MKLRIFTFLVSAKIILWTLTMSTYQSTSSSRSCSYCW